MWYSDERKSKSLYQAALVLAALRVAEQGGDGALRERAVACYDWMESHLLREDGLYWCELGTDGPVGANRPNDIREAGSVVFLGGNMAMGVAHARLYRMTGDDRYRLRAVRTADGYYGGSWSGPAEGDASMWFAKKGVPQQIMTSASSANVGIAAALE